MNRTANATGTTRTIVEQARTWFRYAQILDANLRGDGSRLWVKPELHARYGLRQSAALRARTFILTTHLDSTDEEVCEAVLEREHYEELHAQQTEDGRLALYGKDGRRLGVLNRPAWSWIRPLVDVLHTPKFFLHEVTVRDGKLKAHVVISHFQDGIEAYLMEHYRQQVEKALA